MILVKNCFFFSFLFLGKNKDLEMVFWDLIHRKEPFLAYKNIRVSDSGIFVYFLTLMSMLI